VHRLATPIDFLSAAGSVHVPQYLISGLNSSHIDVECEDEIVWVAKGN